MNHLMVPIWRRVICTGQKHPPAGWLHWIAIIIAAGVTLIEIWQGYSGGINTQWLLGVIFLTGTLPLVFLFCTSGLERGAAKTAPVDLILFLISLAIGIYLWSGADGYTTRIPGLLNELTSLDYVLGIIYLLIILEATRRSLGPALPIVAIIFIFYNLFGANIPGILSHRAITLTRLIDEQVFTVNGIYGTALYVVSTYGFLFILFGTIMERGNGGRWFFDISAALAGKRAGGPAKVAVISSGLFGMISGSPAADVYATGSITIPMMKKTGYSGDFAAAVETVASTGGSIMPPVMGAVAFIAADIMGRPYVDIVRAAIIPAILYYFGCYFQVHYRALKFNLQGMQNEQVYSLGKIFLSGWYYLVPVIYLVWGISKGYTPSYVAVIATVVGLMICLLIKTIKISQFGELCLDILTRMGPVTAAVATAGIVVGAINLVGLGGKFASLVFSLGSNNIYYALIASAVVCIILGMGMPSVSAYILSAALLAPPLIRLGLPLLPTHLFLIYFSILSGITPPVATTAFVAATISGDNPMKIAVTAVKLGAVAFILPFIFIFNRELLLVGTVVNITLSVITALIGVWSLAVSLEGYLNNNLSWLQRVIFALSGILMVIPGYVTDLFGLLLIAILALYNYKDKIGLKLFKTRGDVPS